MEWIGVHDQIVWKACRENKVKGNGLMTGETFSMCRLKVHINSDSYVQSIPLGKISHLTDFVSRETHSEKEIV